MTPMKPASASKKKSATRCKKDPESQVIELRLRNLEEVTSQIDSQLASAELVSQENLIWEIVKRKIEEELKDSISLSTEEVKDLEEQFEIKLTALKTSMEKIKTRLSNTNERYGKTGKSLKEADNVMITQSK